MFKIKQINMKINMKHTLKKHDEYVFFERQENVRVGFR